MTVRRSISIFIIVFSLVCLSGCFEDNVASKMNSEEDPALFKLLSPDSTKISFINHIEENDRFNMVDYFYVYNGGGVAIGDINNDSLPDIYFTGNMVDDRLYINKGAMKFEDVSKKAGIVIEGWSTGVTMVDINHDGFLDIYVCRSGNYAPEKRKNLLYINNGDLTFTEQAEAFGIADPSYSTQAAFFDYDKDGDLDMYLLNHTNEVKDPNNVRPLISDGSGLANDRFYRNDENRTPGTHFTDITRQAGILYDGFGLGIGVADLNDDGWEDVFVTNDFLANDYIYINDKKGTFKEMSKSYLGHVSHFSMGNDLADFNNDGLMDMITMDMLPLDNYHKKKMSGPLNNNLFEYTLNQGYMPQYMRNTLQLNQGILGNGHPTFVEIGQLTGIDATDWSWGPLFADFDNDGLKDLFVTNGYLRDITDLDFINYTQSLAATVSKDSLNIVLKQKAKEMPSLELPNFLFKNSGDLSFENVAKKWGLDQPSLSNGASYADLDNDGDLDIVINNINSSASLYENHAHDRFEKKFLEIRLAGDSLNPNAIGAKVSLFHKGTVQIASQEVTRGYQSSKDYTLHFGLGNTDIVDSVEVKWPDGSSNMEYTVEANQILKINKSQSTATPIERMTKPGKTDFTEVTHTYNLAYEHQETRYNDFNRQFLLPHKHSQQGPGIAVGDINGDGRDDFFLGGGYNHSGQLFYQMANGKFKRTPLEQNESEKYEEDTGVLLFDYDNDGDQDLYIASGSNEFYEGSEYYQDRLYTNDGYGNFKQDAQALPDLRISSSCVRAADFDKDGDLDLFVGGRLAPLKYPMPTDSYLLINQNGKFTELTNEVAPSLKRLGMVTDALWTDYDNDMDLDLIVVGEFMSIQFFNNKEGKLNNVSEQTGLSNTAGWWNSINGGDFDNDGDIDYVLGNLGLNSKYKVSQEEPVTIYAGDFDRNGFIDPIITYYIDHIEYPAHSRDDLIRQIPGMKKKFPDYRSYANASISDILSENDRRDSYILKADNFSSSYLQNNGNGQFQLVDLPIQAQFAPVYGILIQDFDNDGNLDVLLSGNDDGTEVGAGRYDASTGTLLKGNGQGGFMTVPALESGLSISGNQRAAALIAVDGKLVPVFGRNSETLKAYTSNAVGNETRLLNIPPNSIKAKLIFKDKSIRMQEFYTGSSYLSQSTRVLKLTGKEKQVLFYDHQGKETVIVP